MSISSVVGAAVAINSLRYVKMRSQMDELLVPLL